MGDDVMIRSSEIIAILDKQTILDSEGMQEMLQRRKSESVNISNGIFKSLVITPTRMYLSPIAIATLKKKALNGVPING
ncbi:extracellular matrix regulator RemB [Siminovitchia fortis]|uniref:extracellular matrix regulator RemB n=1 Tax=Siminovitchia fortis TaxID=254758 RepID=UPI0021B24E2B|nr:DUF370 domain-containing protein [Siminovitchia fortis]